ncbi:acyltransferase family protein [Coralloluteibacterium thermophilus]|uniref:Acyltransferase family protein n=1 Tax=Coralloluteibacterium thermophilum TaxID=2707049 RepID=A0ABV9NJR9_9GAMM
MERRFDLDLVRVCAFGLLVLYHVGMYYVSWDWHVKSPEAGPALEPFMFLTSPWRLSLLFFVSGVATAFLLAKASRGFLSRRSWRLLVPLAFGMLVIVPPQSYYEVVEQLPGGYHDGYLAFWGRYLAGDGSFCDDDGCLRLPTWNHLWFVAYLWVYTLVVGFAARLAPRALDGLQDVAGRTFAGVHALLLPIVLLALARLLLVGRFESTHALVDDWYNHAQYFAVFLLGFLLARAEGFWAAVRALRWQALGLAAASHAFIVWYFYFSPFAGATPPEALRMAQRVAWGLNQWSAIVAILGFAQRFRHADTPMLRWLGTAVFPVYILHQTVIVVASQWLKPLAIPVPVEGLLLVGITFATCVLACVVVQRIRVLRPLFGLPWRQAGGGTR